MRLALVGDNDGLVFEDRVGSGVVEAMEEEDEDLAEEGWLSDGR